MNFNLTLIGQTIAMVFFVWFCMKFIWPHLTQAIEARQLEIADGLAAAERGRSDLAQATADAQSVIVEARDQARRIVEQANARASAIIEAAKVEGEAAKRRKLEDAQAEIDVETNRVRDELRGQVAAIAIAGAEKVLGREIDAKAHAALLEQLAGEL